ncbi:hypothetical protein GHT09_016659 [Marmota monax]|uniref:Uncharacterized protein n=1 Tax=Marmota monax TaxID=9995 RepID=A0A834UUW1_MARMO|nr:hypothetical protein GHT09_016659 [Marmota monax]
MVKKTAAFGCPSVSYTEKSWPNQATLFLHSTSSVCVQTQTSERTQSLWPGSGTAVPGGIYNIYILFHNDVFLGTRCRGAFSLFKDIDSGTSGSQDFLFQLLDIDNSTSAFWFSATSVIWFQVIEGFLSKEVSYIVSSRREAKAESGDSGHRGCPSPSEVKVETSSVASPKGNHARPSQKPVHSVPMSRGKELLQKAITKQGSSSGRGSGNSSSLLTNARSWGVRVLHVDEMMMHVQQLSHGPSCVKKQEPKQQEGTRPGVESRTRKGPGPQISGAKEVCPGANAELLGQGFLRAGTPCRPFGFYILRLFLGID